MTIIKSKRNLPGTMEGRVLQTKVWGHGIYGSSHTYFRNNEVEQQLFMVCE
jgi:hypothetical protein